MPQADWVRHVPLDTVSKFSKQLRAAWLGQASLVEWGVLQEEGANQTKRWVEDGEQGKWRNALNGCDPLAMHWGPSP